MFSTPKILLSMNDRNSHILVSSTGRAFFNMEYKATFFSAQADIISGLGAKWRYVGYFASSLHPWEEKFGCYHGSKACLGDLKSHVILSYQWQVLCK